MFKQKMKENCTNYELSDVRERVIKSGKWNGWLSIPARYAQYSYLTITAELNKKFPLQISLSQRFPFNSQNCTYSRKL